MTIKKMSPADVKSVFEVVYDMEGKAQITAWRSISHSMIIKSIGAIRQHIRHRSFQVRNAELPISTEQCNEQDVLNEDERLAPYGIEKEREKPLLQASKFHALYDWASRKVKNLSDSTWDEPMKVEDMVAFMTRKAAPTDNKASIQALDDADHTDIETIKKSQEAAEKQEREQLVEQTPEILKTFEGFGESGYEGCDENLDAMTKHQLAIKVVEDLVKAKNKALERALRHRKLTELRSIPLYEKGIKQMSEWVNEWEKTNKSELQKDQSVDQVSS